MCLSSRQRREEALVNSRWGTLHVARTATRERRSLSSRKMSLTRSGGRDISVASRAASATGREAGGVADEGERGAAAMAARQTANR